VRLNGLIGSSNNFLYKELDPSKGIPEWIDADGQIIVFYYPDFVHKKSEREIWGRDGSKLNAFTRKFCPMSQKLVDSGIILPES
jgi:hypothetical protein